MEKRWEFALETFHLFLDFKQAYDSVHRESLWNIMNEFGFPHKLINLVRACVENSRVYIKVEDKYSEPFSIKTGLRQGDAKSPLLFNLILEKVIRILDKGREGIPLNGLHKVFAYADDIAIIANREEGLVDMHDKI